MPTVTVQKVHGRCETRRLMLLCAVSGDFGGAWPCYQRPNVGRNGAAYRRKPDLCKRRAATGAAVRDFKKYSPRQREVVSRALAEEARNGNVGVWESGSDFGADCRSWWDIVCAGVLPVAVAADSINQHLRRSCSADAPSQVGHEDAPTTAATAHAARSNSAASTRSHPTHAQPALRSRPTRDVLRPSFRLQCCTQSRREDVAPVRLTPTASSSRWRLRFETVSRKASCASTRGENQKRVRIIHPGLRLWARHR
jgi:hypothetical protein